MTVMDPEGEGPATARTAAAADPALDSDPRSEPKVVAHAATEVATRCAEFSTFYREQTPGLVTFLRWHGAPLTEAADLAQDAMIKAFLRWGTLTTPKAWIRTVASRELIRRRVTVREDPVLMVPEPVPSLMRPDADLAAFEERHQVLRFLALLPSRQRQVLAWTFDGYEPTEIAAELGITPEAVRASLKKARRALADHVGPRKDQLP
jgi:RNA polymerase sigma factor (sigma-70 family)